MNRLKKIKLIRENLAKGKLSIGSWIQIPNTSIAEIIGQSEYDWASIDMEHGSISLNQLPDLFRALELGDTLPLVRVAHADIKECKQVLDAGAGGLIIPMVESAKQLKEIIKYMSWPPSGTRGVGFSRANLFGKNFNDYLKESQEPFVVAMIEHINAVQELDNILNVKGLDAILIGPYDLSASMNITAKFNDQNFIDIMQVIKNKSEKAKIPCGIHVVEPDEFELKKKIDDGYKFIPYSIDAVVLQKYIKNPLS